MRAILLVLTVYGDSQRVSQAQSILAHAAAGQVI